MSPVQCTCGPKTGKKEDPARKSPLEKSPRSPHTPLRKLGLGSSVSCNLPPESGGRAAERPLDRLLEGPEPHVPLLRPPEGLTLRTLTARLTCRETSG